MKTRVSVYSSALPTAESPLDTSEWHAEEVARDLAERKLREVIGNGALVPSGGTFLVFVEVDDELGGRSGIVLSGKIIVDYVSTQCRLCGRTTEGFDRMYHAYGCIGSTYAETDPS